MGIIPCNDYILLFNGEDEDERGKECVGILVYKKFEQSINNILSSLVFSGLSALLGTKFPNSNPFFVDEYFLRRKNIEYKFLEWDFKLWYLYLEFLDPLKNFKPDNNMELNSSSPLYNTLDTSEGSCHSDMARPLGVRMVE